MSTLFVRRILFAAASVSGAWLLWVGLRNQPDPVWHSAHEIMHSPAFLLQEVPDSLQLLFEEIHGDSKSSALDIISQPYLSNIEWTRFRDLVREGFQKRFMVISGVTGVGSTKCAKHMARLIAGKPENILEINCAPQFDLEYHKKYIGTESEEGRFQKGLLLKFWEKCRQHPGEHYVVVADNFDKINPETFFGPALWESLSSPKDTAVIGGEKVSIPDNFYFFSVTHLGPGSLTELNEEHFKRLGRQYVLKPSAREMLAYLKKKEKELTPGDPEYASRRQILQDTLALQQFIFYFLKSNELVRERYGEGYQLGQGSNIKTLYRPDDREALKTTYIQHLNALQPARPLKPEHFKPLDYAVASNGLEKGSNFISRQLQYLYDIGYLVEISMVAMTALLTALFGWWVFRRREQLMRRYGEKAQQIFLDFEKQQLSAEAAAKQLEAIKAEVDSLVLQRKLNYTEGLYFLAFVEDKVRRIEFARNVSENFLELFNTFMEDDILTRSEYLKLKQFLQSIKHKIPEDSFLKFDDKVEKAYDASLKV